MNNNKYIFVFSNSPDSPSVPQAVFPIEMQDEAVNFNGNDGYRKMMIGYWGGLGKFPDIDKLEPYTPRKAFYPFKVIGTNKRAFFSLILEAKGFQNVEIIRANYEICQKECDQLNRMMQVHFEEYLKENK